MPGHRVHPRQSTLQLRCPASPARSIGRFNPKSDRAAAPGERPAMPAAVPRLRQDDEFRSLAENLPDAVVRFDRTLCCVYANPAAERYLLSDRHAVTGRGVTGLGLPRRLAGVWDDSLRLVFANRQPVVLEFKLGSGRDERYLDARFVPEVGGAGSVDSALVITRDITDRTRTEQALRGKTEELQRINAELEEFNTLASHDLKGPLRTAHGLSSWIEEEVSPHLSEDGRERLKLMRARLRQMDELINATLEYSRAGSRIGHSEEVSSHHLVQEVIGMLPVPPGFTITVADDLPRLRTDRRLLQQVFFHLIGNAIRHHDRDDGWIWITATQAGGQLQFAVVDDGPGIAAQHHTRIFHMFQRGPDARPGSGHGIGLAVTRKLVERAGGKLGVESAPGWGATFRFSWPKLL